jgi:hypothetical protein
MAYVCSRSGEVIWSSWIGSRVLPHVHTDAWSKEKTCWYSVVHVLLRTVWLTGAVRCMHNAYQPRMLYVSSLHCKVHLCRYTLVVRSCQSIYSISLLHIDDSENTASRHIYTCACADTKQKLIAEQLCPLGIGEWRVEQCVVHANAIFLTAVNNMGQINRCITHSCLACLRRCSHTIAWLAACFFICRYTL